MYKNSKRQKIGVIRSRLYGQPKQKFGMDGQGTSINSYLSLLKDIFQRNKLTIRNMKHSNKEAETAFCERDQDNLSIRDDPYSNLSNQIQKGKQKNGRKFNNSHRSKMQHFRHNTMTETDIIIQKYYNHYGTQRSKYSNFEESDKNFNPIGKGHKQTSEYTCLESTKIEDTNVSNINLSRIDQGKSPERKQFNEMNRAKTTSCKLQNQSPPKRQYLHHKKQLSLRATPKTFNSYLTPW